MNINSKNYETLLNEYNTMEANLKLTRQELDLHKQQSQKREADFSLTERNIRDFCNVILHKESQIKNLGKNPLGEKKLPINELIEKTLESYNAYIKSKTDILRSLQSKLEERTMKIDSLEEQLNRLMSGKIVGTLDFPKEDLIVGSGDDLDGFEVSLSEVEEEDKDYVDEEGIIYTDLINNVEEKRKTKTKVTPSSKPSSLSKAGITASEKIDKGYYMRIAPMIEKMDPNQKFVLSVIAGLGLYSVDSICKYVDEKVGGTLADRQIRACLSTLEKLEMIQGEVVKVPVLGSLKVYRITDLGASVYKEISKKDAKMSELDLIIKEHDNLEHGLGILTLEKFVALNPNRENITTFNRGNPCILPTNSKCSYVPDIKYQVSNGESYISYYIEYERAKAGYNQINWNDKMNKMINFTRIIMIVVDNQDTLEKISKMVDKWVVSKGGYQNLSGVVCKITTITYYKENIAENEDCPWQTEYDFNISGEPKLVSKY